MKFYSHWVKTALLMAALGVPAVTDAAVIYSEPPDLPGPRFIGDPMPDPQNIGTLILGDNTIQGQITLNYGTDPLDYYDLWTAAVPEELRVTAASITISDLVDNTYGGFRAAINFSPNGGGLSAEDYSGTVGTYQLVDPYNGGTSPMWSGGSINGFVATPIFATNPISAGQDAFTYELTITTAPVPIPAAVWLFGSGLLGLIGIARRKAN